jgi:hypothetical protein
MDGVDHQPNRPEWDCKACGRTWPCEPARQYLAATTGDSVLLAMRMWSYFDGYAVDRGMAPSANAYPRFIGWTRRPPQAP